MFELFYVTHDGLRSITLGKYPLNRDGVRAALNDAQAHDGDDGVLWIRTPHGEEVKWVDVVTDPSTTHDLAEAVL